LFTALYMSFENLSMRASFRFGIAITKKYPFRFWLPERPYLRHQATLNRKKWQSLHFIDGKVVAPSEPQKIRHKIFFQGMNIF
jgi:hypothetical protein